MWHKVRGMRWKVRGMRWKVRGMWHKVRGMWHKVRGMWCRQASSWRSARIHGQNPGNGFVKSFHLEMPEKWTRFHGLRSMKEFSLGFWYFQFEIFFLIFFYKLDVFRMLKDRPADVFEDAKLGEEGLPRNGVFEFAAAAAGARDVSFKNLSNASCFFFVQIFMQKTHFS